RLRREPARILVTERLWPYQNLEPPEGDRNDLGIVRDGYQIPTSQGTGAAVSSPPRHAHLLRALDRAVGIGRRKARTMTDLKPGAIVHAELSSNDPAATQKFLEAVFGWKFQKMAAPPGVEYWTFDAGSGPGGGLTKPMGGMAPGTLNHVLVESVDASLKKIVEHGGKIIAPKEEVPEVGWFSVFEMPGGFVQAIFEPIRKP
ncbi:MAG: VOC family protein, partial [Thermoplasmata archaeon]